MKYSYCIFLNTFILVLFTTLSELNLTKKSESFDEIERNKDSLKRRYLFIVKVAEGE